VLPVILTPAAQAEILEARDWYASAAPDPEHVGRRKLLFWVSTGP
jgi:hypothetical protein